MLLFRLTLLLLLAAAPRTRAQAPTADPELVVSDFWQSWKESVEIRETTEWNGDPLPLLPMIFFDEPGDTAIPERYHRFADHDATRGYVDTAMLHVVGGIDDDLVRYLKYYEVLDILGYRMTHAPDTRITLRGGYAAENGESAAVATKRAEAVRSYLTTVWTIPAKRITIATSSRESEPTENDISHAEARRVAIETTTWDLFAPVPFTLMTRSMLALSPRIDIAPNIPLDRIRSVEIVVTGGDREIARAVVPPEMLDSLHDLPTTWIFASREPSIGFDTVRIEARVTDRDGVVRRSKAFVSPVMVSRRGRDLTRTYEDRIIFEPIPFFTYRDSTVTPYQGYLIRRFVDRHNGRKDIAIEISDHFEISERIAAHDSLMPLIDDAYWLVDASTLPADHLPRISQLRVHRPIELPLEDDLDTAERAALVALHGRMIEGRFKYSYDLAWKKLSPWMVPGRYWALDQHLLSIHGISQHIDRAMKVDGKATYSYSPLPEGRLYDRSYDLTIYPWND